MKEKRNDSFSYICLRGICGKKCKCKWEENVSGKGVNLLLYKFLYGKNKIRFTNAPFDYDSQLTAC